MEFLTEYNGWLILCAVLLAMFLVGMAIVKAIPKPKVLKEWSMQEAVFYGFLCLSFATLIS